MKKLLAISLAFIHWITPYASAYAMRAPAASQTPTAAGIEEAMRAGAEEMALFIDPQMDGPATVAAGEQASGLDPTDPAVWARPEVRNAGVVVIRGVLTKESRAEKTRGFATVGLKFVLPKPIVTIGAFSQLDNRTVTLTLRPDPRNPALGEPLEPPALIAVYNSTGQIIAGTQVFLNTNITGLFQDPRINRSEVERVFLRGIPTDRVTGGLRRGLASVTVGNETTISRGPFANRDNHRVGVEIVRDSETEEWDLENVRVFNGARENITADDQGVIGVYLLNQEPADGVLPAEARLHGNYSFTGPTLFKGPVRQAPVVALDGVPAEDLAGLGVGVFKIGARGTFPTDLPIGAENSASLLVYVRPNLTEGRQGAPTVLSAYHNGRRVYPAQQARIATEPRIEGGRIVSATNIITIEANRLDTGQFWRLSQVTGVNQIAYPVPVTNVGGFAGFTVNKIQYRIGGTPYSRLEGDRLLLLVGTQDRRPLLAFRLLNGARVNFAAATAGAEEAVLAQALADQETIASLETNGLARVSGGYIVDSSKVPSDVLPSSAVPLLMQAGLEEPLELPPEVPFVRINETTAGGMIQAVQELAIEGRVQMVFSVQYSSVEDVKRVVASRRAVTEAILMDPQVRATAKELAAAFWVSRLGTVYTLSITQFTSPNWKAPLIYVQVQA